MTMPTPDELGDARRKLDEEYAEVRRSLATIRERLDRIDKCGPEDDISEMLEEFSDVVKKARDGGLLGSGAKGHHRAREHYLTLKERSGRK